MPTLHWLTRDKDIRAAASVPYRLLGEVSGMSEGGADVGNMLIQGDNLETLKALLSTRARILRTGRILLRNGRLVHFGSSKATAKVYLLWLKKAPVAGICGNN